MLVLSRKPNEKIIVGDNVTITVLKIRGNTVRLGIEAPREISVVRGELSRDETNSRQNEPVTVEFKSNLEGCQNQRPSLRLIQQEVETDIAEDPEPASTTGPVNRMKDLVSHLTDGRKAE